MKRYNKNLGDFGEDAAEEYLKENGYIILERNYNARGGEIDIVALDDDFLVFTEVKTRSSHKFGLPSEAVDYKKQAHLIAAAEDYYEKHPLDRETRFDIIEVDATLNDGFFELYDINHLIDVIIE